MMAVTVMTHDCAGGGNDGGDGDNDDGDGVYILGQGLLVQ